MVCSNSVVMRGGEGVVKGPVESWRFELRLVEVLEMLLLLLKLLLLNNRRRRKRWALPPLLRRLPGRQVVSFFSQAHDLQTSKRDRLLFGGGSLPLVVCADDPLGRHASFKPVRARPSRRRTPRRGRTRAEGGWFLVVPKSPSLPQELNAVVPPASHRLPDLFVVRGGFREVQVRSVLVCDVAGGEELRRRWGRTP